MALQGLVVQIQGLSSSAADLDSLNTALRAPAAEATLRQHGGAILDAVQSLDVEAHSLGCVYLLEAKGRLSNATNGDQHFLAAAARFVQGCTPEQVRRAPAKFASLCRLIKVHALAAGRPKAGILPLRAAVGKLCATPNLLSPIHADLFELCLMAKCYSAASPIIDADVTSVDPGKTACTATDALLYCYYGGMIEAGRRRYAHALDLLLTALTAPTMVVNAITVAASKKYALVALLHLGEVPPLPKHTAQAVSRYFREHAGPYLELAKLARAAADSPAGGAVAAAAQELAEFVASKAEVWGADGNAGLVALAAARGAARRVQALMRTYSTLPLAGVAAAAGLPGVKEAEDAVLAMADGGEVHVRISQREGILRFVDEDDALGPGETAARLRVLMRQAMELSEEVLAVDHSVACDRAYIAKAAVRSGGAAAAALGGPGSAGAGPSSSPGKGPIDVPMAEADRPEPPTGTPS